MTERVHFQTLNEYTSDLATDASFLANALLRPDLPDDVRLRIETKMIELQHEIETVKGQPISNQIVKVGR